MRNQPIRTYLGRVLIPFLLIAVAFALPTAAAAAPTTGGIAGTVTDMSGEPVAAVEVCAYELEGSEVEEGCEVTANDGSYEITGLPPGNYTVVFWFLGEGGVHYYHGTHSLADATLVPVTEGQVTPGIDEMLDVPISGGENASISGTVTSAATGMPIEGAIVCAIKVGGGGIRCRLTGAKGDYALEGLEAGQWNVYFSTEGLEPEYLEQAWHDRSGSEKPDPVTLGPNTHAEGIDAALRSGGGVSGTVRSAVTGAPLEEIRVCLVDAGNGDPFGCDYTESNGEYGFEAIPSGTYKVAFSPEMVEIYGELVTELEEEAGEVLFPPDGYPTEWWDGQTSFATATAIPVTTPLTRAGVDGLLGAPPPSGPGGSTTPPLGASGVTATPLLPSILSPAPKLAKCRQGFVKRKVHGRTKCVRLHKAVKHKSRHKKP